MTSLGARLALRFGLTAAVAGLAALTLSLILFAGRMTDAAREASAGFDGVMSGQMERAGDFMARELAARGRTALLDLDAGALTRIAQTATGGGLAGAVTFYDAGGRAVADQSGPLPLDAAPPPRRLRAAAEEDSIHWRDDAAFRSGRAVCIAGRCVGWVVVTIDAAPALAERAAIEGEIAGARSAFLTDAALLGLGALAMTAGVAALTGRRLGARAQGGATAVLRAIDRMTAAPRDVRARPRPAQIADMKALAATLAEDAARGAPLDAVGEATLVADASGAIETATPALHALLRVAPTTLEGADAHVTFALGETGSAETLAKAFDRLVETPTGDGERLPVLAAAAVAGDASARKVVCVLRSADRLVRAEQAEAQRRFRIETADRARDAFVTAMREEIGRPARPPVADESAAPAKKPGLGAKLAAVAAPAARALDRLLRLARLRRAPETPPADPVDAAALAAAVAEGVASAAEFKRLALSVRVQPGAPVVLGDFEALRRIGAAFADNAVAATSRGEVVIDVAHRVIGEQAEIALTVQDSGPGLDAAGLGAVTRLLSKPGDGGSGLALAARLAREMGAAIDVGGAPGDGASFTLTFRAPIDPNAAATTGSGVAAAPTPGASGGMAPLAPMAPMALGGIGLPPLGPGVGDDDAATTAAGADAEEDAAPLVMIPMAAAAIMGGDPEPAASNDPEPGPPPLSIPMATAALMGDAAPAAAEPEPATAEAEAAPADRGSDDEAIRGEDDGDGMTLATPIPESDGDGDGDGAPSDDPDTTTTEAASNPETTPETTDADPAETDPQEADIGEATARRDAASEAPEADAGPLAIVAEANPVDRIVLTTFLRKAGYACEIAATPADVLDALPQGPALLMLGGAFGGADGVQLVETVRAREKASSSLPLAIYAVASAGDEALAEALRAAGADDILTRPIRRDALEAKLGARLDRAAS
jgi:signal transduction histidine kinase/CheY-like chemotaxis protein